MGDSGGSCPPPVVCPHTKEQFGSNESGSIFPTEAVLGGTLGGLSIIALALIIYASFKHWNSARRRRPSVYRKGNGGQCHRKGTLFGDPLFAYDVNGLPKSFNSYSHMQPDMYIAGPYVSPRRQISQRQALAAMLFPRDDSSESEFCPRGVAREHGGGAGERGGAGAGFDDSHYAPSIIAGSFVYHPPHNLPPHLARTAHAPATSLQQDLSYDSFKNDHLYDSSTRGMTSSTLNNHHQPPDFYL